MVSLQSVQGNMGCMTGDALDGVMCKLLLIYYGCLYRLSEIRLLTKLWLDVLWFVVPRILFTLTNPITEKANGSSVIHLIGGLT